jgi:hypothetical protein
VLINTNTPLLSRSVTDLLKSLNSILSDSSASMQASTQLTTAADKAAWWKQRLQLDQRMQQVLVELGGEWLGPWRCLLMQPPGEQQLVVACGEQARLFVAQNCELVTGERAQNGWVV